MKEKGKLKNADGTPGVRLICIDPPFATKQEFRGSQDQKAYQDKIAGARFLEFLRKRLVFLRELLSKDGNIYVHLDWKKGHYVKVLMDEVFKEENFVNEIIWWYRDPSGAVKDAFMKKHDVVLFYAKNNGGHIFNLDEVRIPYKEGTIKQAESGTTSFGRIVKVHPLGRLPEDVWQIAIINSQAFERTGYPTQKPEAILERIIKASSNPGDLVMDCFAGSGTTCAVSEKLNRRWIGVDCGKLAIYTMQKRLLNIADSKDLENPKLVPSGSKMGKKYGKQCKPFTLYNAGLYDYSMVMLNYDFNGEVFDLDEVFYAEDLKKNDYEVRFDEDKVKGQMMIIYIDIFGNEKREIKTIKDFRK